VRVEGQLAFNDVRMIVRAATAGFGLGFVMKDQVASASRTGAWSVCWRTGVRRFRATFGRADRGIAISWVTGERRSVSAATPPRVPDRPSPLPLVHRHHISVLELRV
jgi:hypothetical protein